jgi:hypothetical protein
VATNRHQAHLADRRDAFRNAPLARIKTWGDHRELRQQIKGDSLRRLLKLIEELKPLIGD